MVDRCWHEFRKPKRIVKSNVIMEVRSYRCIIRFDSPVLNVTSACLVVLLVVVDFCVKLHVTAPETQVGLTCRRRQAGPTN